MEQPEIDQSEIDQSGMDQSEIAHAMNHDPFLGEYDYQDLFIRKARKTIEQSGHSITLYLSIGHAPHALCTNDRCLAAWELGYVGHITRGFDKEGKEEFRTLMHIEWIGTSKFLACPVNPAITEEERKEREEIRSFLDHAMHGGKEDRYGTSYD